MAAVHSAAPILPVADMAAAVAFYQELGFDVIGHDDGYALVLHGDEEIFHLRLEPGLDPVGNPAALYLHVDDADAWHARWRDVGASGVADEPWGMREFSLRDPSGNLIRVGHNL